MRILIQSEVGVAWKVLGIVKQSSSQAELLLCDAPYDSLGGGRAPAPSCVRLPSASSSPHSQSIMGMALCSAIPAQTRAKGGQYCQSEQNCRVNQTPVHLPASCSQPKQRIWHVHLRHWPARCWSHPGTQQHSALPSPLSSVQSFSSSIVDHCPSLTGWASSAGRSWGMWSLLLLLLRPQAVLLRRVGCTP